MLIAIIIIMNVIIMIPNGLVIKNIAYCMHDLISHINTWPKAFPKFNNSVIFSPPVPVLTDVNSTRTVLFHFIDGDFSGAGACINGSVLFFVIFYVFFYN